MASTQSPIQDVAQLALGMSTTELRLHVERCARLMQQATLLSRLPDKGDGIRRRHDAFAAELQRRERSDAAEPSRTAHAADEPAFSAIVSTGHGPEQQQQQQEIVEKYRHHRVPVETTIRRAFGGTFSEKELQRMMDDVPAHYFLTYDETVKTQRAQAKELRRRELQQLSEADAQQ